MLALSNAAEPPAAPTNVRNCLRVIFSISLFMPSVVGLGKPTFNFFNTKYPTDTRLLTERIFV